jgi:hypothetical protein
MNRLSEPLLRNITLEATGRVGSIICMSACSSSTVRDFWSEKLGITDNAFKGTMKKDADYYGLTFTAFQILVYQ